MNLEPFDICDLSRSHILRRAMFQVQTNWHMAYAKLLAMNWAWTKSAPIPFGATDGRILVLNPSGIRFLESQPRAVEMVSLLLVHEALHGLLDHPLRGQRLPDNRRAQMAADYIINAMITSYSREKASRMGMNQGPFAMIEGGLLDPDLSKDYCLEELYRILGSKTDPGTHPPSGGQQPTMENFPGMPGALPDLLPIELGEGETIEEAERSIETTNERIMVQSRLLESSAFGSSFTDISAQRHPPRQVSWISRVEEWASDRSEVGWLKPFNAPLFVSSGLIGSGRGGRLELGDFLMVLDVSGSVPESDVHEFLKITQFIVDELRFRHVHFLGVNTRVVFESTMEWGDLVPDQVPRGGGTRFLPAFQWTEDNVVNEIEGMVYLTDGHNSDGFEWGPPSYPVLWALTGPHDKRPPWGEACLAFEP